jgi:hypothetical protein
MNVEIGTEAAQFPEKQYINGIAVAVRGFMIKVVGVKSSILVTPIHDRIIRVMPGI